MKTKQSALSTQRSAFGSCLVLLLLLVLFSLSTVARATPSSDLANQAAYLRNQRAAAAHNLTIAEGQLTAAKWRDEYHKPTTPAQNDGAIR